MILVKHNGLGLLGCQGQGEKTVALIPGVNKIDPADWEKMSKHPLIQARVESGALEVLTAVGKASAAVDPVVQLLAQKPGEALKLAAQTIDAGLLSAWAAAEKRPAVKKAIDAQLKKLAEPVEFRTKKTEDKDDSDED